MADHKSTPPVCPTALQEQENSTREFSPCHVLSNNNDGFLEKQDITIIKDSSACESSEIGENHNISWNGKSYNLQSTREISEVLFDDKRLNGLVSNEEPFANDNGIVKNIASVVNEDISKCQGDSKQNKKTKEIRCQNHDANNEGCCIPKQNISSESDKEIDNLLKQLENVSVISSSNTDCADCEKQNSSKSKAVSEGYGIEYVVYESERQMPDIMRLITKDLSEPYSIYTYRYFIHNWPKLCFLAKADDKCVGAIVCKLDLHKKMARRGYIAMLAVDSEYRRRQIGSTLVTKAIEAMIKDDCDEVVLETEITNQGALHLYENLGFVRDKRLFRYYLNGVDALRLKLWLR